MERLKQLRNEQHFTQKEIAEKVGVDRTTYVKYETGASEPNFDMLLKLATLFEVSADYLLGRTDKKEPPVEDERPNADVRAAQLRLADDLYDCLTPENRAKADSYLAYLLAEQAGPRDK